MKKVRNELNRWYCRTLFVAMTIGALVAAIAAPNNFN